RRRWHSTGAASGILLPDAGTVARGGPESWSQQHTLARAFFSRPVLANSGSAGAHPQGASEAVRHAAGFEVGGQHESDEILEAHAGRPAEPGLRLRVVALQDVHLGRTGVATVELHHDPSSPLVDALLVEPATLPHDVHP